MKRNLFIFMIAVIILSACASEKTLPTETPNPTENQPLENEITQTPMMITETATALPSATPTATSQPMAEPDDLPIGLIAFIGMDGNLHLADPQTGNTHAITEDGEPMGSPVGEDGQVRYKELDWSSDGRYLAYLREVSIPETGSLSISESLWAYDLLNEEHEILIENQRFAGFDWQPDTHKIAYAITPVQEYFTGEIGSNSNLASGIQLFDVDTNETSELVTPKEGISLAYPHWSPQGTYLAFQEIVYIEGQGLFAYYQPEIDAYVRWERPIGNFDFSPDETLLAYDTFNYQATGEEQIYLNNLQGNDELPLSNTDQVMSATYPVFSPDGTMISYHTQSTAMTDQQNQLYIQPLDGAARDFGSFIQIGHKSWSADGNWLAFYAGGMDNWQVVLLDLQSGDFQTLAKGWQIAWQPPSAQ